VITEITNKNDGIGARDSFARAVNRSRDLPAVGLPTAYHCRTTPTSAQTPQHEDAGPWVFYDGSCSICTGWVRRLGPALAKHGYQLAPLNTQWVQRRLGVDMQTALGQMWVITPDGQVLGGADAALHLSRATGWLAPLRVMAVIPGGMAVMRALYRWIASHRHCIGGSCAVRGGSLWIGLAPLLILPSVAMLFASSLQGWQLMWLLAGSIYAGCKWLSWWRTPMRLGASVGRSLVYLFLWPGMDAAAFLDARRRALSPGADKWMFALGKVTVGLTLLFGVARLFAEPYPWLAGWIGLIGMVFVLHFGLFDLLSLFMRRRGIDAQALMDLPAAATSLGAFWGRRWNRAFQQLAHAQVFRPLHRRIGVGGATFVVFVISGLIHDLVISVPAGGGYGLPTAYFLLQWLGLTIEKSTWGKAIGLGDGVRGWVFTVLFTVGPAYWLFHPIFIDRVIIPFMDAIGAFWQGGWSWPC